LFVDIFVIVVWTVPQNAVILPYTLYCLNNLREVYRLRNVTGMINTKIMSPHAFALTNVSKQELNKLFGYGKDEMSSSRYYSIRSFMI
jgi:hypothetical protein